MTVLLLAASARGTIVNTLQGFTDDTPGWSGAAEARFSQSGGNTEVSMLAASARIQWLRGDNRWRVLGSARRASSGGEQIAKALMSHLRHNRRLSDHWHTLAFLQLQQNPFIRLQSRFLAGLGLRWDVTRGENRLLAIGAAHMLERETIEAECGTDTDQRLSMFLRAVVPVRDGVTIAGLGFYQPLWTDFGDGRAMAGLALNVELTGNLSLQTGFDLEYDSRPAAGVDTTDWSTTTGLSLAF